MAINIIGHIVNFAMYVVALVVVAFEQLRKWESMFTDVEKCIGVEAVAHLEDLCRCLMILSEDEYNLIREHLYDTLFLNGGGFNSDRSDISRVAMSAFKRYYMNSVQSMQSLMCGDADGLADAMAKTQMGKLHVAHYDLWEAFSGVREWSRNFKKRMIGLYSWKTTKE